MELVIQISLGLLFILFAAFAEGIEWKERYLANSYSEQERLNKLWHWLQFFERGLGVLFGLSVGALNGLGYNSFKIVFLVAVLFWIIYDIIINIYASRNIFAPSKITTSIFDKFYVLKPILLIASLALLLIGCSSPRIIERVKIDTIKVSSPIVEETLPAKYKTDSVVVAQKIIERDTTVLIKYYPKKDTFYLKVKPDTVTITKIDTVTQLQMENKSGGYYLIGIVALAVTLLIIIIVIKK